MVGVRERGAPGRQQSIYRPETELRSIDQANPRFGFGLGKKWTKWTNVVVHSINKYFEVKLTFTKGLKIHDILINFF